MKSKRICIWPCSLYCSLRNTRNIMSYWHRKVAFKCPTWVMTIWVLGAQKKWTLSLEKGKFIAIHTFIFLNLNVPQYRIEHLNFAGTSCTYKQCTMSTTSAWPTDCGLQLQYMEALLWQRSDNTMENIVENMLDFLWGKCLSPVNILQEFGPPWQKFSRLAENGCKNPWN